MNFENVTNHDSDNDTDYYEFVYGILERTFDYNDVKEYTTGVNEQLKEMVSKGCIRDYNLIVEIIESDTPLYYISVAWVENDNHINICGKRITFNS